MKKMFLLLGTYLLLYNCQPTSTTPTPFVSKDIIQYVDPFIGTGFHGHTFPGATLPFGMVQLSPDTHLPGWDASSGYHYQDSIIYGFSHTHLSGTGIGDMGDILILPFTGEVTDTMIGTFKKESESAKVGSYQVTLDNFKVKAELTATKRTGMHRYTYPQGENSGVLIDLAHVLQPNWGHKSILGELEVIDNRTLAGKRLSSGWAYDHPVYFYMQFSKPFRIQRATNEAEEISATELVGKELKVWLAFEMDTTTELLVKTGISSVSEEGARKNLLRENANWNFDRIRTAAEEEWRQALSKIEIKSTEESVLINFYTALYHSMLAPMLAQDVDGKYRGMDKQIHQAPEGFTNYTVFSLWDTFRGFHPLMNLLNPTYSNEWVRSLLQKYKEGGVLPKWPLASNYTGTMVGYPAVAFLADALESEIDSFDLDLALEAAVNSSIYSIERSQELTEPRSTAVLPKHLLFIEKNGFIPADSIGQSVSYGLECAYYDWCIAEIAKKAGREDIELLYRRRSGLYKEYFDPTIGFMRGKLANGNWREPFDPYYSDHEVSEFVEGNSWQWMWFVPHDIPGYIELMGGEKAFEAKLDELFSVSSEVKGENASMDISGLIGQYAHGNEPSHHVAHLYNYVGQAPKAQEKIDQILQTMYLPEPGGIIGNEDCGAMSAWYVLNALGFYKVCPGSSEYVISRPLVDRATIHLENGNTIEIQVENNAPQHKYVDRVVLNGKELDTPFFEQAAIQKGGRLEFWMKK